MARRVDGKPAFAAADVVTALFQVCNDEPMPVSAVRSDLSRAVDEALARALAKRPKDRYAHASEFAVALRAAVSKPTATLMQSGGDQSRA
jgi:hypothetical protein